MNKAYGETNFQVYDIKTRSIYPLEGAVYRIGIEIDTAEEKVARGEDYGPKMRAAMESAARAADYARTIQDVDPSLRGVPDTLAGVSARLSNVAATDLPQAERPSLEQLAYAKQELSKIRNSAKEARARLHAAYWDYGNKLGIARVATELAGFGVNLLAILCGYALILANRND